MKTLPRLLVLGLVACCACAQSGAGAIQGTISDATASAIPGATVRVANNATRVITASTVNETGFFTVPGLFAGAYTVTFYAPGMKTSQVAVTLRNAQNVVLNPTLQIGDVAEQVTVNAGEIQLVTYNRGNRVSFKGVVDLPFGRGKKFLGSSNRWLDALVGGFQVPVRGPVGQQLGP